MNYSRKRMSEASVKRQYIPKGTARIGRPTEKTAEEVIANKRRLERDYSIRRGRFITKIKYYEKKFVIPCELLHLPQSTDEEVQKKCKNIFDFVKNKKWVELLCVK